MKVKSIYIELLIEQFLVISLETNEIINYFAII